MTFAPLFAGMVMDPEPLSLSVLDIAQLAAQGTLLTLLALIFFLFLQHRNSLRQVLIASGAGVFLSMMFYLGLTWNLTVDLLDRGGWDLLSAMLVRDVIVGGQLLLPALLGMSASVSSLAMFGPLWFRAPETSEP